MSTHHEINAPGPPNPPDAMDRLGLSLDGSLTGEALASFETRLAADASLRRQVDSHRAVSAWIQTRMSAPVIDFPALRCAARERGLRSRSRSRGPVRRVRAPPSARWRRRSRRRA